MLPGVVKKGQFKTGKLRGKEKKGAKRTYIRKKALGNGNDKPCTAKEETLWTCSMKEQPRGRGRKIKRDAGIMADLMEMRGTRWQIKMRRVSPASARGGKGKGLDLKERG